MEYMGMQIIESTLAVSTRQYRKPRCKSKRIAKKWKGRNSNYKTEPAIFIVGGKYLAHPVIMAKIVNL